MNGWWSHSNLPRTMINPESRLFTAMYSPTAELHIDRHSSILFQLLKRLFNAILQVNSIKSKGKPPASADVSPQPL